MLEPGTANERWALLYSTLGYEANAAKRAWLRPVEQEHAENSAPTSWELVGPNGESALHGDLIRRDLEDGLALYEADFSACTEPGTYRLCARWSSDGGDSSSERDMLATLPFEIGRDLLFQRTFAGMALEGPKARQAPASVGGGFYEANLAYGDVAVHALFAVGLMHVIRRRARRLTALARAQLYWSVDRAMDYVFACCDPQSGKVSHRHRKRGRSHSAPALDTAAALWALATYADLFRGENATRARQAWYQGLATEKWLKASLPASYPPALEATVNAGFWWHSGDPVFLEAAFQALEADSRMLKRGEALLLEWPILRFEGLFWLRQRMSRDVRLAEITNRALKAMAGRAEAFAQPRSQQPRHEELLAGAIDALYLAELLEDAKWAESATAALSWLGGLHLGVPGVMVENPPSDAPLEAAAFIRGLDVRSVKPPVAWYWPKHAVASWAAPALALVGLHSRLLAEPPAGLVALLSEGEIPAEGNAKGVSTSMGQDALWLYAACMHGDYFAQHNRDE